MFSVRGSSNVNGSIVIGAVGVDVTRTILVKTGVGLSAGVNVGAIVGVKVDVTTSRRAVVGSAIDVDTAIGAVVGMPDGIGDGSEVAVAIDCGVSVD